MFVLNSLENPYLYEIDQLELTESVTSVKQPIQRSQVPSGLF